MKSMQYNEVLTENIDAWEKDKQNLTDYRDGEKSDALDDTDLQNESNLNFEVLMLKQVSKQKI